MFSARFFKLFLSTVSIEAFYFLAWGARSHFIPIGLFKLFSQLMASPHLYWRIETIPLRMHDPYRILHMTIPLKGTLQVNNIYTYSIVV